MLKNALLKGVNGSGSGDNNNNSMRYYDFLSTFALKRIKDTYTVTRPHEGFRHPDWMAPESTVRGRENDFLVRPGYIHPHIPGFSGGYGIFRRFTL